MTITRKRNTIIALTILATSVAIPALAAGRRGMPPNRPAGVSIQHPGGLLGELIFPCQSACVTDGQDCVDTANATALSCISSACPTEVTAAQDACAENRAATACKDAVGALAECGDACLETRTTALTACRETLTACRDTCESNQ